MKTKAMSIAVVILSLAASAALAGGLTELMQTGRMTVAKVDREGDRFFCVEHQRWTHISKPDAAALGVGDIVRVDVRSDAPAKVHVLRTAAQELSSGE